MRVLISTSVLCALLASPLFAEEARWLRYPAISPDGEQIVFSYRGDLFTVPTQGGDARALTTHAGVERMPVWSPDGSTIAFASDRHGQFDVFVMPRAGGAARRITFHSNDDLPSGFTPDGTGVLITTRRLDDPRALVASRWMPELYVVPVDGGRARQLLTTPAFGARMHADGKILYEDLRGFENIWRKHHTSSVARDIRLYDPADGSHRKLTSFVGEDRNPIWGPGGAVYYLSEQGGAFNVWRLDAPGGAPTAVTKHATHPVRFLSISDGGTLCYAYAGDLYVVEPDSDPRKVAVDVRADDRDNTVVRRVYRDGATEMAVSPDGEEVAFVARGEVFVASVEHGTTKRVTATPEQERSVSWAPDGRTLYYAAERGRSWSLYKSSLVRDDERHFATATLIEESPVLVTDDETFQPLVAPDGKTLAYLHEREGIRVLDLASGTSREIVPAARNYSYTDGDIQFRWSPDSRWLAMSWLPSKRWLDDVGLANVETGALTNVSESGYASFMPRFSPDGKIVLYATGRYGRRNHGSWGSDLDVMGFYVTQSAYDRATLSPEDLALRKAREKREKEEKAKSKQKDADDDAKDEAKKKKEETPAPIEIDLADIEHRLRRLTLISAPLADFVLSKDGEVVLFTAKVEDAWGLWMCRMREGDTRKLTDLGAAKPGELVLTKDGKSLFVRDGKGRIRKLTLGNSIAKDGGGSPKSKSVPFAAEMTVDLPRERACLFEHVWRQAGKKFYEPNLHGANWPALRAFYGSFLPHITNNHDFAELMSEMLGELNASHTGASYRNRNNPAADATASLGLLYEVGPDVPPLQVAAVLRRGPCDRADSKVVPGAVITHIDGASVAEASVAALLNHRAGKPTRLTLRLADGTTAEQVMRPISLRAQSNLLYERWVEGRRAFVEKASGGRLGYVHIRGMNDRSFRRLYREALGRHSDKEGLVVDTRFNGGGWLHDDLVKFFDAKEYAWFVPRNKTRGQFGTEPLDRWSRPSCVVVSEGNYSDAHIFPYAYQTLGLGKVVGAPVPGTGTAVWWETLIDPTLRFGIPQVGMMDAEGHYLENLQLEPDVLVLTEPEDMAAGRDPQLHRAVDVLLEQLK